MFSITQSNNDIQTQRTNNGWKHVRYTTENEPPNDKNQQNDCAQQRLRSAWADLSLHWAHMPFCWFCHEAAQIALTDTASALLA